MNKNGTPKAKYCIQSEKHHQQTTLGLCSLMEHQSLVDIAICCGSNILHAHKIVLAASSPLFREELEKNPGIEQVIISSCEFSVIRSLIEFMYCGETIIDEDLLKYLVAAARLFQMRSLENLALDYQFPGDLIVLPKPQFISKKPKYPAYPFNANLVANNILKPLNYNLNNLYKPHKVKRKFRMEAEHQACIKEAQASRLAIANLKKEIASAPQANTFIIEETCTETTVENFIPAERQNFVELDYDNLTNQVYLNQQQFNQDTGKSNIIQLTLPNNGQALTADKIKNILGNEGSSNVEIMFKTNEGNYVTVTDDVLQNLQKDGLQYQVIDEDGRMGEVQELQLLGKDNLEKIEKLSEGEEPKDLSNHGANNPESFNFFNNSQMFNETNSSNEPTDKILGSDNNKEIELITLSAEDMKPSFMASSTGNTDGFETVDNFFGVGDPSSEMTESADSQDMKDEIDVGDDKCSLMETIYISPRRSTASLKFSPDIFFADMTNNDSDVDGPSEKRPCLSLKKVES